LSQFSPRRFLVLLRRTSPLDRVALAVLALGFVSRVVAALGRKFPYSTLLGFLSFVAIVYLVIRLIPWFRTNVMWPLRNRLIVAYVFIAVVPVILLFSMVGVAAYGLYLQLGAHLLHDDFEEHISRITTDADAFAAAIEQETAKGASPEDESVLSRPDVARLITAARMESPDLKVFLNHGAHLLKRGDGHRFSGLVEWNEKPWIACALKRDGPAGDVTILVAEPVNSTFIDSFSSELGPIQLIFLRPAGDKQDPNFNFTFNGRVYVPGEQVSSKRRTLAPAENFLDARVAGASTIELAHMACFILAASIGGEQAAFHFGGRRGTAAGGGAGGGGNYIPGVGNYRADYRSSSYADDNDFGGRSLRSNATCAAGRFDQTGSRAATGPAWRAG
jgi:hypothetical protein